MIAIFVCILIEYLYCKCRNRAKNSYQNMNVCSTFDSICAVSAFIEHEVALNDDCGIASQCASELRSRCAECYEKSGVKSAQKVLAMQNTPIAFSVHHL